MAKLFLAALVNASEKAANLARVCRQDEYLLSLLVMKKDGEKNPRFLTDFKTLADVLVQETVKHDLCKKFPQMEGHVHGEESNKFEVSEGEVVISVTDSEDETIDMLNKVLSNRSSCETLARIVHTDITTNISIEQDMPKLPENIGIWIDPIDSTLEYIHGEHKEVNGITSTGLPCVTVLIGAFDRDTAEPIMGVINQPFFQQNGKEWIGRYIYGVNYNGFHMCEPEFPYCEDKVVAISPSESEEIKEILKHNNYTLLELAGAGYKLLNVIIGNAQAYLLTKPSTYHWDICSAHAILNSLSGDIIEYKTLKTIRYKGSFKISDSCNKNGIVGYRETSVKEDIVRILGLECAQDNTSS